MCWVMGKIRASQHILKERENAKQLSSWCGISMCLSLYRVRNFYYLTHLKFTIKLVKLKQLCNFVSEHSALRTVSFHSQWLISPCRWRSFFKFVLFTVSTRKQEQGTKPLLWNPSVYLPTKGIVHLVFTDQGEHPLYAPESSVPVWFI